MIEQRKISTVSNRMSQLGGRRIPEAVIERDYCLAWFLIGLSHFPVREKLIFKGGTALRRCYFKDYRYSEDLDFTLIEMMSLEDVQKALKEVFTYVKDETGILFGIGRTEPASVNAYTFYLTYEGPLPGRTKEVKTDITFKEKILRPVEEKTIIRSFDEYSDFEEKAKIRVYSLDEMMIEKICALFSSERNEPRDLYDAWYILTETRLKLDQLVEDVKSKMEFKGGNFEDRRYQFEKKELRLEKLWKARLDTQVASLPEFQNVFRIVKRTLRQAGLG